MSCGDEVEVGGPLDEARLRSIAKRGWLLRNRCVSEREALEYGERMRDGLHLVSARDAAGQGGETPTLREREGDDGDLVTGVCEIHIGCGEMCGIFAEIPYDGSMGGVPYENAEAIAHAGRDMLDMVHEIIRLRKLLEAFER